MDKTLTIIAGIAVAGLVAFLLWQPLGSAANGSGGDPMPSGTGAGSNGKSKKDFTFKPAVMPNDPVIVASDPRGRGGNSSPDQILQGETTIFSPAIR